MRHRRSDLRATDAFLRGNRGAAFFIAVASALGGVASVLGYLRAQSAFFQWALALALWAFAAFCVQRGVSGPRDP